MYKRTARQYTSVCTLPIYMNVEEVKLSHHFCLFVNYTQILCVRPPSSFNNK